jgi:hypothetical protein
MQEISPAKYHEAWKTVVGAGCVLPHGNGNRVTLLTSLTGVFSYREGLDSEGQRA